MSMIETRIIDKEEWHCDKCEKFKECNVKIDNMVILPGSTIILDDNELSISKYLEEYGDVL